MISLKLGQLIDAIAQGSLQAFAQDGALPISTAFRLKRLWKAALVELDGFNEQRIELLKEYGTLNEATQNYEFVKKTKEKHEDGRPIIVEDAKSKEAFEKAIEAVKDTAIELPGERFIAPADFEPRKMDAPQLPFSPQNLLLLEWLITDGEDDVLNATNVEEKEVVKVDA